VTRFFTTADLGSANATLNILRNDLLTNGSAVSAATKIRLTFCAVDNYYTGVITDCIGPVQYTLGTPRFSTSPLSAFLLGPGGVANLTVSHNPAGDMASSQSGLLLFYRNSISGREAEIVTVTP
jgi:hypothetical protein